MTNHTNVRIVAQTRLTQDWKLLKVKKKKNSVNNRVFSLAYYAYSKLVSVKENPFCLMAGVMSQELIHLQIAPSSLDCKY